jgi:hypothetical protein
VLSEHWPEEAVRAVEKAHAAGALCKGGGGGGLGGVSGRGGGEDLSVGSAHEDAVGAGDAKPHIEYQTNSTSHQDHTVHPGLGLGFGGGIGVEGGQERRHEVGGSPRTLVEADPTTSSKALMQGSQQRPQLEAEAVAADLEEVRHALGECCG